jgi:type II secretory pathway pseudopilin PulG
MTYRTTNGFTLIELMVAATASIILSGLAIAGVVTLQQMSQRLETKLIQEEELQRALRFMAADIRAGQAVKPNPPPLGSRQGLFQIVRPNNQPIGYYTDVKGDSPWSGPRVIFRRDFADRRSFALIDQIAEVAPVNCQGPGTLISNDSGFSLRIEEETQVTLCLRGDIPGSETGIEASAQTVTRVSQGP